MKYTTFTLLFNVVSVRFQKEEVDINFEFKGKTCFASVSLKNNDVRMLEAFTLDGHKSLSDDELDDVLSKIKPALRMMTKD